MLAIHRRQICRNVDEPHKPPVVWPLNPPPSLIALMADIINLRDKNKQVILLSDLCAVLQKIIKIKKDETLK